jgi:hypothetical protein
VPVKAVIVLASAALAATGVAVWASPALRHVIEYLSERLLDLLS